MNIKKNLYSITLHVILIIFAVLVVLQQGEISRIKYYALPAVYKPKPGEKIALLPLINNDGKDTIISFSGQAEKYLLITFSADCPHCYNSIDKINNLYEKYKGKYTFIGLSRDSLIKAADFARNNNVAFPVFCGSPQLLLAFNLAILPTIVKIENGTINKAWTGELNSESNNEIIKELDRL